MLIILYPKWLCIRYQWVSPNILFAVEMCSQNSLARSYPASGKFTESQRDLYSAVLSAQKALITLCHESADLSLYDLHRKSCELLRTELTQIGFFLRAGDLERILYPHFLSHPIGIGKYTFRSHSMLSYSSLTFWRPPWIQPFWPGSIVSICNPFSILPIG